MLQLNHLRTHPTCDSVAILKNDPAKPFGKSGSAVDFFKITIRFDERFLSSVLRKMKIAQYGICIAHSHILETLHNHPECIEITCLSADDEHI